MAIIRVSYWYYFAIAFIIVLLAILFYPLSIQIYCSACQNQAKRSFNNQMKLRRLSPVDSKQIVEPGGVLGNLEIPRLNLQVYFFEGTSSNTLLKGPGHKSGTPFPGEGGNCVITGSQSFSGSSLSGLSQLEKGDLINVDTVDGQFTYMVTKNSITEKGNRPTLIKSDNDSLLTISTFADRDNQNQDITIQARLK